MITRRGTDLKARFARPPATFPCPRPDRQPASRVADLFHSIAEAVSSPRARGRHAPSGFGASPEQHKPVGWLRAIGVPPLIPQHFTAKGRFENTNHLDNLLIGVPHFQQGLDLIALFRGQLCVGSHRRSSSWLAQEATMLPHLTA